jgi:hypothetical protein
MMFVYNISRQTVHFCSSAFLSVDKNEVLNEISMTACHSEADMTNFGEEANKHIGPP